MVYSSAWVVFLAFNVGITTAGQLTPPLGQKIRHNGHLVTIKGFAEPVLQERDITLKRQESVGTWALRSTTCPENTTQCKTNILAMPACCPNSLTCVPYGYQVPCCANSQRCEETAKTFPKCGDPSWTLWAGGYDKYFCCLQGEIGFITTNDNGACGPSSLHPTGSQVATSVGVGDQPPPTSAPSGSGSSHSGNTSKTPTSPSTALSSISSISSMVTPGVPTGTTGNQNTNSNSSSGSSNSGSSGLPTGAIAGIAAGAVVILILAGVAIYFALQAGKRKGATEALAAFQQEQRSQHGNNTYLSEASTPGASQPPIAPAPQGYAHTPDNTSMTTEKYAVTTPNGPPNPPSSAPAPQWTAPTNHQDQGPRYEADATNTYTYPTTAYPEMDGYNNQRRQG